MRTRYNLVGKSWKRGDSDQQRREKWELYYKNFGIYFCDLKNFEKRGEKESR